jgi:hypothetical protein
MTKRYSNRIANIIKIYNKLIQYKVSVYLNKKA